jgi:hypothetical protein
MICYHSPLEIVEFIYGLFLRCNAEVGSHSLWTVLFGIKAYFSSAMYVHVGLKLLSGSSRSEM